MCYGEVPYIAFNFRGLLTRIIIKKTDTKEAQIEKSQTEALCNEDLTSYKSSF